MLKSMLAFTGSYSNQAFPEPLNDEDEKRYLELYMTGDSNARNKLIEHNLRLVAHIIKKYEKNGNDPDDLISIGTIGLIKGVNTYKMDKNIKLTTYCARCIENEILMHFRSTKNLGKNISIDEEIGFDKEGNEITLMDILITPKPDFAEDVHLKENINNLKRYLSILNERELEVITKRYGLGNNNETTQKEIAKQLNISRSYVSRIEKRALTKLLREFIKHKNHHFK